MFSNILQPEQENVDPRTDEGIKGHYFPPTNPSLTENRIVLPGCEGCSKAEAHGPPSRGLSVEVPFGESRYDRVAGKHKVEAENLMRCYSALWYVHEMMNGKADIDWLYNLGATANNAIQLWNYKIISVNDRILTLFGANPKTLPVSRSFANPDWIPGQNARLLSEVFTIAMPVGASVHFAHPSVLEQKLSPFITRVFEPHSNSSEVQFDVELSHSVNHAMTLRDRSWSSPEEWGCTVFAEVLAPEDWPNWQPMQEAQWGVKVIVVKPPDLLPDGEVELFDTEGNSTRVLHPDMGEFLGGPPMAVTIYETGKEPRGESVAVMRERVRVTDTGTGWKTRLSFRGLMGLSTLQQIVIGYRPEATAGDTDRVLFPGSCANSQKSWTGSYAEDQGWRCTNVDCIKHIAGTYRKTCWDPTADGFSLGNELTKYRGENMESPPSSVRKSDWISKVWTRATWVIRQLMPGFSTYFFERPSGGGGSVGELIGGFYEDVPAGKFQVRDSLHAATLGKRVEVSAQFGGTAQELVKGAFASREQQSMRTLTHPGRLGDEVPGWTDRENELRESMDSREAAYPSGNMGRTHLHHLTHGGNGQGVRGRMGRGDMDMFVVDVSHEAIDEELSEEFRQRFG